MEVEADDDGCFVRPPRGWSRALKVCHLVDTSSPRACRFPFPPMANPFLRLLHQQLAACSESGDSKQLVHLLDTQGGALEHMNDALDFDGKCAMHNLAAGGHVECVRLLLERGANCDCTTANRTTPLAMAAMQGKAEVAFLLLQARANPNALDDAGTMPLHWAAHSGSADCVRCLLQAHADPTCRDEDGLPVDTATAKRHEQCALLLGAAAHLASGQALPPILVTIENHAPLPVRLFEVHPCDPNERELETIGAATVSAGLPGRPATSAATAAAHPATPAFKQGASYGGYELRLRGHDGTCLATHWVAPQPSTQTFAFKPPMASMPWEWEDGHRGSGVWQRYDDSTAAAIARAEAAGLTKLLLPMGPRNDTYTIDLAARTQVNGRTGFVRTLRQRQAEPAASIGSTEPPAPLASTLYTHLHSQSPRVLATFPGAFDSPPPYWGEGTEVAGESGGAGVTLRELQPSSPTLVDVIRLLSESGQNLDHLRMRAIYLAENPARFDQYAAAKRAFERRLGADKVQELWLWHGTSRDKVPMILANGFLRDFTERAAYGRGVYFARSASYSLSSTYAKPTEGSGEQYLLLVRVLVGEPCQGRSAMERPTQKPNSPELYDSMVDSLSSPKIVVLSAGSDNRAYPEFVLRVKRSEARG